MTAARLKNVSKYYGRRLALDDMSFEIPSGAVCGLIGPNGAGKTTAMGVLAGLLQVRSGSVELLGCGPFSIQEHVGRVGIMPQDSVPSPHAPIIESLKYYGRLQGLDQQSAADEAEKWLSNVHLFDRARAKYGALSHGMRRRFSVAQAMLGSPELVLLDEPTSGLDPELVVEIRNMIVDLRGKSTVLVSSHILSELESMCDHAIFVEKGKCTRQGAMSQITGRDAVVRYRIDQKPDLNQLRTRTPEIELSFSRGILTAKGPSRTSIEEMNATCLRALLDLGVGISEVIAGESLESAYLEGRKPQ